MYKLLLCLRYLRTRYIALASIISVTLGVATMIVVNSVMSGFQYEMHQRLHSILADIIFESHSLGGFTDVPSYQSEIRRVVGDDLEGMTATVHVPAMLSFQFRGQWITRQVNLIGINKETYAQVGDFGEYLLHPENRRALSFQLREGGYEKRIGPCGWEYRRQRVAYEREYRRQLEQIEQFEPQGPQDPFRKPPATHDDPATTDGGADNAPAPSREPDEVPSQEAQPAPPESIADDQPPPVHPPDNLFDRSDESEEVFDEMNEQHTGIILGIAIGSVRGRGPDGEIQDHFLCLPGDDVKITLPTAGTPPKAVSDQFTVVDFYECKMSEYDGVFAFVPLKQLQRLRGMIDPATGQGSVTSIQLKLKEGADLDAVRDRLQARFPVAMFHCKIQTWRDMQGPLLAAVEMETTILNILLFLIIAVAGFGILATFFMIVVEKTRDIGILKALGAPSRGVMAIFLSYGLSLGIVGSGVGVVLGVLFVKHINRIAGGLEYITGKEVFDQEIYYFHEIPTIISVFTISWIMAGAMLIAVLASVLPALRAARLRPVEALRYE